MGIPSRLVGVPQSGPASPAMPDPGRLVRRSVSMLKRLGMPEASALRVILACTVAITGECGPGDEWPYEWVEQVRAAAQARMGDLQPVTDNSTENDDADRRRSGRGRHESPA